MDLRGFDRYSAAKAAQVCRSLGIPIDDPRSRTGILSRTKMIQKIRESRSLSPVFALFEAVKRFESHGSVSIDFLARTLGKKRSEIEEDIQSLLDANLIEVDQDNVRTKRHRRKKIDQRDLRITEGKIGS